MLNDKQKIIIDSSLEMFQERVETPSAPYNDNNSVTIMKEFCYILKALKELENDATPLADIR